MLKSKDTMPPMPLPDTQSNQPDQPEPPARTRVPLAIEDWLTAIIMALLALITFANVLVRYFTSLSLAWTEEISIFLMILLTLVGTAAAVARNRHIRIGFFADGGSLRRRRNLILFSAALTILVFAAIAVLSARVTWDDIRFGNTSPGLGVPEWIYSMWLPIVSFFIVLRALGVILRKGRVVDQDAELPEPVAPSQEADS